MKILRLQIPRLFLSLIGLKEMFENIEHLEILNTYRYDEKNFFSTQKIIFYSGIIEKLNSSELEEMMKAKFDAHFFNLIEKKGNSILCIMKQSRDKGFWSVMNLESGPWAIIFPILVDSEVIILSIIAQDEYLNILKERLENFTQNYEILAQNEIKNQIGLNNLPAPDFTERQREIAMYAARHGYFETPKHITAQEIADKFEISITAVNNNLRSAEQIAMKYFFGSYIQMQNLEK